MGIKHLNRFLREEAQDCIKFISLAELSGKKIAVDISIYMYKYASEGTLLENMYLMLSTLRYYEIVPVFIFDGKPPPEKKELLNKRKEDKKEAQQEYNELKKTLDNNSDYDDNEEPSVFEGAYGGIYGRHTLDHLRKSPILDNSREITSDDVEYDDELGLIFKPSKRTRAPTF